MNLVQALDEFSLLQRRRHRGENSREKAAAFSALREFLIDYSGFVEAEEVRSADLYSFLLEYYPNEEEPDPDVAVTLLDVAGDFAVWLLEHDERGITSFATRVERLRGDLPRVLQAARLLKEHARRHDLEPPAALVGNEFGGENGEAEEEEVEEAPVGTIGSGVNRVARLDDLDYAAAEEDYFTVRSISEEALSLQSAQRETLQEAPAEPVTVPAAAASLLRVGDTIHAEVAPSTAREGSWELLEVFGIRPGGYE